MKIEYRVKPVTRYIVTKFVEDDDGSSGVGVRGEYENADVAYEIAYSLCSYDHERLGYPVGDERITYPRHVERSGKIEG